MVGTSRVGRLPSCLQLSPTLRHARQLVVGSVVGVHVVARVTYVQFAVGTHPRRRVGRRAELAVDGHTAGLAVSLHDAVKGVRRRQRGDAAVDDHDAGTGRTADDQLGRRTGDGGGRAA